ncbi:MAG TPA: hypothetical protein VHW91_02100 [Candidatus Dormibacteraeota bacterium]|nr:hypothetical protein [Candidatus Dormibacteraeota bacterium]
MSAHSEFGTHLEGLIRRIEAWNYADSDAGAGVPVEIAQELSVLASIAPTAGVRRGLRRAQDALDDGLSADAVAAELYRIRDELSSGGGYSGAPPSPSR